MKVKALSRPAWRKVYRQRMRVDFPAAELKSEALLKRLEKKGQYRFFGFFDDEEKHLLAYALLEQSFPEAVLLDYLAVDASRRGQGIGRAVLRLLPTLLVKDTLLLAEVEDSDFAPDEKSRALRQRRVEFYSCSGWTDSGVKSLVVGEHYRILSFPAADSGAVYRAMVRLYLDMAGERFCRRYISVYAAGPKKSEKI